MAEAGRVQGVGAFNTARLPQLHLSGYYSRTRFLFPLHQRGHPYQLGAEKGGGMKKYLFDLPPRDPAQKPYAAGLTPEVDAWAKANKHRIGTYRSHWCRPQYSAFVGNIDMIAELCTLYDDYGLIAYGNTKGAAVQQLYKNLQERKATVEDVLRFLLGHLHDDDVKKYAAAFGVDMADGKEGE